MTLYQLKVFATVARLRNFTLAAEGLRVRQPSVSLLIKGLERELEIKLFEKLGNKIHLTVAGEKLLQRTEEILAKAEGIKEEMDEIKGLKKGRLSVGGSALATAIFLPEAIQAFKKAHPGVEVALKVDRSKALMKKLLEGEVDVAVLGRPPTSPLLQAEHYRDEEIVVVVSPNHPLHKRRLVPLGLIAKEPLIVQHKGDRLRDMVEQRFAEQGLRFLPILEMNSELGGRDAIKSAVASGLGIGFIARCHITSELKSGKLKRLKVPDLGLKTPLYIAVHKNRLGYSLTQTLQEFLMRYKK